MSKHMKMDLDRLLNDVATMAELVDGAIRSATQAFATRDVSLAEQVIGGDDPIDRLENIILEASLTFLAVHQPVAGDLRRIGSIVRIATDLERMGDLAGGIAERALELSQSPDSTIPLRLNVLAEQVVEMVERSLSAFVQSDVGEAETAVLKGAGIKADSRLIFGEVLSRMKSRRSEIEPGVALIATVQYIERIAGHAHNIAEEVIYIIEGFMVRHHPEVFRAVA